MKDKSYLIKQQKEIGSGNYDFRVVNLGKYIFNKLPLQKGKLLDVGFGNGLILDFFKNKGFTVEGIEISKYLISQIKRNKAFKKIKIMNADITKRSGKSNYDIVVAADLIEHIKDDKIALQNLLSFVKQNGYLVITVPAHEFLYGKRDMKLGHFRRYDIRRLRELAEISRSKVIHLGYWNFLGFFIYFLYEKILRRSINESFREKYKQSSLFKSLIELELKMERNMRHVPWGLTLVMILQKKQN